MPESGLTAAAPASSPARASLAELIQLKAAGESLNLAAIRMRTTDAGGHISPFKGRGVEYDESRPYQPGDDLRTMDWRVTARTGKAHTKVFRDERDRSIILWLDLRRPMHFATRGVFKAVRAAQTAALIGWSAAGNGDRLGGLIFSEQEHIELRPRLGRRAVLRMLEAVTQDSFWEHPTGAEPDGQEDAEHTLSRLSRVARPGSMIFLLSDFRNLGPKFELNLRKVASHCDVFLVHMFDPIEIDLPPPGHYRIQSGKRLVTIDTDSAQARLSYELKFQERRRLLQEFAKFPSVHVLQCATNQEPRAMLAERFQNR